MQFQVMVDDSFTHKVNAPISQEAGIYGALKGGRFLVEHVKPATLRPNAQEVINLLTISALLQSQVSNALTRLCPMRIRMKSGLTQTCK